MSIERTIIKRLQESRRIDEAWPPILNNLSRPSKELIRKEINKLHIDIENTPHKEVTISSGRDPRLKSSDVIVFEIAGEGTTVRVNRQFIPNFYVLSKGRFINQMPWKDILPLATSITALEFNNASAANLMQKRRMRADQQQGVVKRYTPQNKPRYATLDKSGYVIDPNKYKRMFAELNLNNASKILEDARNIYSKLASNLDKIDWESEDKGDVFESYSYVMKRILEIFKELNKSLKDYEAVQKNSGKDDEWFVKYYKESVLKAIQEMKNIIMKAKKYL